MSTMTFIYNGTCDAKVSIMDMNGGNVVLIDALVNTNVSLFN